MVGDETVRNYIVLRRRSRRSGRPGSRRRRDLIFKGEMERGSKAYKRSKYGADVVVRRHIETTRRKSRAIKTNGTLAHAHTHGRFA